MSSGFVDIPAGRLWRERTGTGPPLVLIHGFSHDGSSWADTAAAFAGRYDVLLYDRRGYGRSSMPEPGVPYSHHGDLLALLDAEGIGRAHVAGLSAGGQVALDLALAAPARVWTLFLVSTAVSGWPFSREFTTRWRRFLVTAQREGVPAAQELWKAHPLLARARDSAALRARCDALDWRYSGWHWLHDDPVESLRPPAFERLGDVSVPTHIVLGAHDIADFVAIADALATRIPGATRTTVPDAGHMVFLERPDVIDRVLGAWLAQHP